MVVAPVFTLSTVEQVAVFPMTYHVVVMRIFGVHFSNDVFRILGAFLKNERYVSYGLTT